MYLPREAITLPRPSVALLFARIKDCCPTIYRHVMRIWIQNGDTELENTISDFIESFRHQGSTLSKLILAKSSEISWNLSANSFLVKFTLSFKI